MPRLAIVTVITAALTAACATSPRATSGPSPNVSPRDTSVVDTTRDTTGVRPDTSTTAMRLPIEY
ncbi:MAG TPA: hypothetical protein VIQ60_01720 [Gemmatimonadaceae bacterium]